MAWLQGIGDGGGDSFAILQDENHNQGVTFNNIFFKPNGDCSCVRQPMSKE